MIKTLLVTGMKNGKNVRNGERRWKMNERYNWRIKTLRKYKDGDILMVMMGGVDPIRVVPFIVDKGLLK